MLEGCSYKSIVFKPNNFFCKVYRSAQTVSWLTRMSHDMTILYKIFRKKKHKQCMHSKCCSNLISLSLRLHTHGPLAECLWYISRTKLETLQECRSCHLIGWILPVSYVASWASLVNSKWPRFWRSGYVRLYSKRIAHPKIYLSLKKCVQNISTVCISLFCGKNFEERWCPNNFDCWVDFIVFTLKLWLLGCSGWMLTCKWAHF